MTDTPCFRHAPILWICLTLVLVMALACGATALFYVAAPPPPLDILVLGLDAALPDKAGARADSLTVVGVNPAGLQVSLLSAPGDLPLEVTGHGIQPIGAVVGLGEPAGPGRGIALTAAALEAPLGVSVDRFVRLRFEDFVALINAVGGVPVDVERTLRDEAYPVSGTETTTLEFSPGRQWMDGERALQYVRTLHADDEFARAGRQQQVIQAFARQIRNPLVWPAVLSELGKLDTDLTLFDLMGLTPVVLLNAGRFEQRTVDGSLLTTGAEGETLVDWSALRPWVAARFD